MWGGVVHLHEHMREQGGGQGEQSKVIITNILVAVTKSQTITNNKKCRNSNAEVAKVLYKDVGDILGPNGTSFQHPKSRLR